MLSTEAIKAFPLFNPLSNEGIKQLQSVMVQKTVPAGEYLFLQDDPVPPVLFVHQGSLRVYRVNKNGREQTLLIATAVDAVNLPMVFAKEHQAHANAVALSDCILFQIQQDDYLNLVNNNTELAILSLEILSAKIQNLVRLSHDLSLVSVRSRLAKFLIEQASQQYNSDIQWTQTDMANQIGTVRELISRNLRQLMQEGVIAFQRQNIQILDLERLTEIANE